MRKIILRTIIILFFMITLDYASDKKKEGTKSLSIYFPANDNVTLVYKTSFGESTSRYTHSNEYVISSNEADKFKYIQKLLIKDDGVYVLETYQYLRIFLFIKKEDRYTYSKPLIRIPFPLSSGKEWQCESDEYSNGDTNKVILKGKVIGSEILKTNIGDFETIKLETIIESGSSKNSATEWYASGIGLVKAKIVIDGGGLMGFVRDILGYSEVNFELVAIRKD